MRRFTNISTRLRKLESKESPVKGLKVINALEGGTKKAYKKAHKLENKGYSVMVIGLH